MILNHSQAHAVHIAMCALNNVGALAETICLQIGAGRKITAGQRFDGTVAIDLYAASPKDSDDERYHSISAFATAYGLQQT